MGSSIVYILNPQVFRPSRSFTQRARYELRSASATQVVLSPCRLVAWSSQAGLDICQVQYKHTSASQMTCLSHLQASHAQTCAISTAGLTRLFDSTATAANLQAIAPDENRQLPLGLVGDGNVYSRPMTPDRRSIGSSTRLSPTDLYYGYQMSSRSAVDHSFLMPAA